VYVIDADLKSYFDTIPHDKLMSLVREEIVDGSVIKLLENFLQAGIMEEPYAMTRTYGFVRGA
jgi:retron-type reverse transcriptase